MTIELDAGPQNGIVHAPNGAVDVEKGFRKYMSKRGQAALDKKNGSIVGLTIMETELDELIKEQKRKVDASPEQKRLKTLMAKRALVRRQKEEETLRAQGIIEAELSEVTNKSLGEIVEENVPELPQARRGRPRKEV